MIFLTSCKNETVSEIDFNNFLISKGKIGKIKIGMDINEAEKLLTQFSKKEAEAYDFGFDGGGKAYIYSSENEPIIAIIPKRDSKEILVIIALSKRLKTKNGLNPKSKVYEILQKYPKMEVNQDLIMESEFMHDTTNNWNFVFLTKEVYRIGKYNDIEEPTKPIRKEIRMDWIEIE